MNRHWKFGWGGAADNRILGNIYIYDAYIPLRAWVILQFH